MGCCEGEGAELLVRGCCGGKGVKLAVCEYCGGQGEKPRQGWGRAAAAGRACRDLPAGASTRRRVWLGWGWQAGPGMPVTP